MTELSAISLSIKGFRLSSSQLTLPNSAIYHLALGSVIFAGFGGHLFRLIWLILRATGITLNIGFLSSSPTISITSSPAIKNSHNLVVFPFSTIPLQQNQNPYQPY